MEFDEKLIGCCGFYCRSCPTYHSGNCTGCLAAHRPGDCFTNTCVQEKQIRFCGECGDFPCDDLFTKEKATVLAPGWMQWQKEEKGRLE